MDIQKMGGEHCPREIQTVDGWEDERVTIPRQVQRIN